MAGPAVSVAAAAPVGVLLPAAIPVATPGASLCGSIPRLDRLVVTRSVAFPQDHLRFRSPPRVVVARAGPVRTVARALCALPAMPNGAMSCPADFGVDYHLAFSTTGGGPIPSVTADASGCGGVRGGGGHDLRASTAFWDALGEAMGLPTSPPGYARYGYPFGVVHSPAG